MRGGLLPCAFICAALGLALAVSPRRTLGLALAALVLTAFMFSWVTTPPGWQDGLFLALWISIALTAATVHLPRGMGFGLQMGLSLNAGVWAGLITASSGLRWTLVAAAPFSLLCLPAAWMVSKGWGVAIKVVASWLIAIALLAASLTFVPTPGYKPDHMD